MKNKVLKILGKNYRTFVPYIAPDSYGTIMIVNGCVIDPPQKLYFLKKKNRHDPPFCSAFVTRLLHWSVDRMRRSIVCESWLVRQCLCTVQSWQRSLQRWKGNILCITYYLSSFSFVFTEQAVYVNDVCLMTACYTVGNLFQCMAFDTPPF